MTLRASPTVSPPRRWLPLLVATVVSAVAARIAGTYLVVLIESPLFAHTRENPTLYLLAVSTLWLGCTGVAVGMAVAASHLADLRGPARRHWLWFVAAVVVSVGPSCSANMRVIH